MNNNEACLKIYNKIKTAANEQGLSMRALGFKAHVSSATLYRWQHALPNIVSLDKVAEALNLPNKELFTIRAIRFNAIKQHNHDKKS